MIIPDVERFGEKNKNTDEQGWEDIAPGSALEGLLLPDTVAKNGKHYCLLKVVTQPATADQLARLGNDRAPVVIPAKVQALASAEKPNRLFGT